MARLITQLTSQLTPGPGCHQTSSTAERAKSNRKPNKPIHLGRQSIVSRTHSLPRRSKLLLANYSRSVEPTTERVHPSHQILNLKPTLYTNIQARIERTASRIGRNKQEKTTEKFRALTEMCRPNSQGLMVASHHSEATTVLSVVLNTYRCFIFSECDTTYTVCLAVFVRFSGRYPKNGNTCVCGRYYPNQFQPPTQNIQLGDENSGTSGSRITPHCTLQHVQLLCSTMICQSLKYSSLPISPCVEKKLLLYQEYLYMWFPLSKNASVYQNPRHFVVYGVWIWFGFRSCSFFSGSTKYA